MTKNTNEMVDIEMSGANNKPTSHKLLIDNLSPSIWCMNPGMKIDSQRKQAFTPTRPDELTPLSPQAWTEFQTQLLETWRLSRNEGLKIHLICFVAFMTALIIANMFAPFPLFGVALLAFASACYGIRHSVLRGDRIREVIANHEDSFRQAGCQTSSTNLCGTVKDITIEW